MYYHGIAFIIGNTGWAQSVPRCYAAQYLRPEEWQSHSEEVLLGCALMNGKAILRKYSWGAGIIGLMKLSQSVVAYAD